MYRLLFITGSLLSMTGFSAALVLDQTALENDKGLFFDGHNHNGGVVPAMGVIDAEKFIYGGTPSVTDLQDFWSAVINSSVTHEKILTNSLFSSGTKMFLTCNEPMNFCSQTVDNDKCRQRLVNGIDQLLTSTPLTSFSTAYGIRRNLVDIPNLPGRTTSQMRAHAFLFELARTKVDVVEMSKPSMGGYVEEGSTRDFDRYAKLTEDLLSNNTSKENQRFKNRLNELKLKAPRVKWLLMIHTTELGSKGDDQTANYANGQCTLVPWADSLKTDPETGLYSVLVNFKDVVGVDVAGPESTCFTKDGMQRFKNLAETTYFASRTKQKEKGNKGKLVVRAHVGEGFPLSDEHLSQSELGSCNGIRFFPTVTSIFDREKQVALHRVEAQKNIAYILDAISELKKQYPDIDQYVVFRLAHLTHIDDKLAKRAKEVGITADANLSSNIATGAWPVPSHLIQDHLVAKGLGPADTPDLLAALRKNGASLGDIFDNHGLKWLLLNHIPTVLGSDGSGVEHVDSLRAEYLMAKELISYWTTNDPIFAQQKVHINTMLQNQKKHYDEMGY